MKGLFLRGLRPEDPISEEEKAAGTGLRLTKGLLNSKAQDRLSSCRYPACLQTPPQTPASKPLLRPRGGGAMLSPSSPRRVRCPVGLLTSTCRSHKSSELIPLWPIRNIFVANV